MLIHYNQYLDLLNRLDERFIEAGEPKGKKWLQKLILKHYLKKDGWVVFENAKKEKSLFEYKFLRKDSSLQERQFCRFMS